MLLVFAVAYGLYTRSGSGISQRPHSSGRNDDAGGAAGPSRMSSADDETEGVPDTWGTK